MNVRSGAGTNFGVVGALQPGEVVEIVGQNSDASWFEVRLPDGDTGWVAAFLVERVNP